MSKLYVVPVPIGNIKDITLRAMDVLRDSNVILCEDTRVTQKLLKLLDIDFKEKKLLPYFEHNERSKVKDIANLLELGYEIALVSDAGTPLVSDPGYPLINAIAGKFDIEVLPGASSVLTALIHSGFPTDKFTFLGYLPRKTGDRKKLFKQIRKSNDHLKSTLIAFENLNRLESSLEAMSLNLGEKVEVCLCRELTKLHEEIIRGDIKDILTKIRKKEIQFKGELVIVFRFKY